MKMFFAITATLLYVAGFFGCVSAPSGVQQLGSLIVFVIATIFFVGAGVIEAIERAAADERLAQLRARLKLPPAAP